MTTILIAVILTAAPPLEVRTIDGRTITGSIAELDAGLVSIETAEGLVSLKTDQLMTLSPQETPPPPPEKPAVWIDLIDGTSLIARQYAVADGRALVTLLGGQIIDMPVAIVSAVRLKPQSESLADQWSKILDMQIDADLLVVDKSESIDYHRGVLRDVTETAIQFELGGDVLPVKPSKAFALRYHRPAVQTLPETLCLITDAGGSRWPAASLSLSGDLHWTTPAGLKVNRPLETISKIDFSAGKIIYLGDMKPESVEFTPYFGSNRDVPQLARFHAPCHDRSLEGGPLQLDDKQYVKGLALHSRTKIVYRLPGRFRRFVAVAGIDDRVRPHGNVRLVIHGDDKILLQTTLTGTDPPQRIDLDLSGVRRLTILADFGDKLDTSDHLDLCQARILK